jgi:hypothetical protein
MASVTNHFLLIHWKRPAKLEEFLLPPIGVYQIGCVSSGIDGVCCYCVFCHALNTIPVFVVVVQIRCYPIMVSQQPFWAMYVTWQWAPMKVCAKYQSYVGGCGW